MDLTSKVMAFGRKARLEAERAARAAVPAVKDAAERIAPAMKDAAERVTPAVKDAAGKAAEKARELAAQAPVAARHAAETVAHGVQAGAQAACDGVQAAVPAVRRAASRTAPAVVDAVEKAAPAVAEAAVEAAQSAAFAALKGKRPAGAVANAAASAAKTAASRAGKTAAKAVAEVAVKNAADMREADAHAHTVHNTRTGQDVVVEAYVKGPGGKRDYARVYPKGAKDDFGPVGNKAVGALLIMAGLPMLVLPGPGAAAIAAGMYYLRKASDHDDVVHVDAEVRDPAPSSQSSDEGQPRTCDSNTTDQGPTITA